MQLLEHRMIVEGYTPKTIGGVGYWSLDRSPHNKNRMPAKRAARGDVPSQRRRSQRSTCKQQQKKQTKKQQQSKCSLPPKTTTASACPRHPSITASTCPASSRTVRDLFQARNLPMIDIKGATMGAYLLDLTFPVDFNKPMSEVMRKRYTKVHAAFLWQSSRGLSGDLYRMPQDDPLYLDAIASLHTAASGKKIREKPAANLLPAMIDDLRKKLKYGTPVELALALAPFTFDHSLASFKAEFQVKVTKHQWANARFHAAVWGVGTAAPKQEFKRHRIKKSHFDSATRFLLEEGNIYQLAYGTSKLTLSDGTTLELPQRARDDFISGLYKDYLKQHTDADGICTGAMSRTAFYQYAKTAAKKDPAALAALDPTAIRHGKYAFKDLSSELSVIEALSPLARSQAARLRDDIKKAEVNVKNTKKHLSSIHVPGSFAHTSKLREHCAQCAFGDGTCRDPSRPRPCPAGVHDPPLGPLAHCADCGALALLRANFNVLIEDARRHGDSNDETQTRVIDESEEMLTRIFKRLLHYERHEFRAAHEAAHATTLLSRLDSSGVLITCDWYA